MVHRTGIALNVFVYVSARVYVWGHVLKALPRHFNTFSLVTVAFIHENWLHTLQTVDYYPSTRTTATAISTLRHRICQIRFHIEIGGAIYTNTQNIHLDK